MDVLFLILLAGKEAMKQGGGAFNKAASVVYGGLDTSNKDRLSSIIENQEETVEMTPSEVSS